MRYSRRTFVHLILHRFWIIYLCAVCTFIWWNNVEFLMLRHLRNALQQQQWRKKWLTLALTRNTQAMVKWHSNWFNVALNEFDEWIYLLMFNHSKPSGSCNSCAMSRYRSTIAICFIWLAISEWYGKKNLVFE